MAIDFSKDRWERIRHNARLWWAGELGRPLIQIAMTGRDPGRDEPKLPALEFLPCYDASISPQEIVDRWDYDLSCCKFLGDSFPVVWTNLGPGILAGFLGAIVEPRAETVWFRPHKQRRIQDIHFQYDPANPWLKRVKDICRAAIDRWGGLVQIAMTDLGGTLDVLSTFRPGEKLLLDLYDHPEEVKRLTWEIHELWFRYFEEIDAILRCANPGYSAWPGFYSEQTHYMLQCDFAYMLSPEMFDELVAPELAASCRRLVNPFYHLDGSGQLAHLDSLLAIPNLKGVQWVPGAGAPDCTHWPEVYRRIRDAGKLIQIGSNDKLDRLDVFAEQLGSAEGIVICGTAPGPRERGLRELLDRYGAT
jgi:5-methyltetrahydrofolate--homocysteine methyltransferase